MKTTFTILHLFFACQAIFAQVNTGISVQGIARDAEKAALVDEQLPFTFEIKDAAGGTTYYKEAVQITTDPYGVFSHIIGTATPSTPDNFNEIPFGNTHMRLVITVRYNQNDIVVSDAPFQYSPYAKSAENGVPVGTIVAFAGTEANLPAGWVLCDGRDISTLSGAGNLRELIGNNVPDLKGMFLRGTGTSIVNSQPGPALRGTQDDGFENHTVTGTASGAGAHSHGLKLDTGGGGSDGGGDMITANYGSGVGANNTVYTNGVGNHTHPVSGSADGGIDETRPVSYGVNYIIKL